jgi:ATP-binding cassette subfamily C (CFTR/MRP) protein 1
MQAGLLFAAQKFMLLSLPMVIPIVYIIQKVYLRTSRGLRLVELESRSAVFSSFLETVSPHKS